MDWLIGFSPPVRQSASPPIHCSDRAAAAAALVSLFHPPPPVWRARLHAHRCRHLLPILLLLALLPAAGVRAARAQQAEPIAELQGRLAAVADQLYSFSLSAADGTVYALLGAQPAVEQQLRDLAPAAPAVAVTGTLQRTNPLTTLPLVVVESLRVVDGAAAATPVSPLPTPTGAFGVPEETLLPRGTPVARPTVDPAATPVPDETGKPAPATPAQATATVPAVTATVAPTVAPTVRLPVQLTVEGLNLRKGPGSEYAISAGVRRGEVCDAVGRAPAEWLLLACARGDGWGRELFLQVEGDASLLPLVAVAPPDTAAPDLPDSEPPFNWRALAYPNRTLSGPPAVGFNTPVIDFNWGLQAPVAGLPVDNFSLRFDAAPRFAPGDYLFTLTYDDGARLIVNDRVVISDWNEGGARNSTWQGRLGGIVPVRVEFFDAYHDALVRLQIERVVALLPEPTPLPTPIAPGVLPDAQLPEGGWLAAYFTNLERAGLATLARAEPADDAAGAAVPLLTARTPLARDWGASSPAPAVLGLEGWSARWQGRFRFAAGAHELALGGSGRAWVWIDDILVAAAALDEDAGIAAPFSVTGGWHTVVVEFAAEADTSGITVGWRALDALPEDELPAATPATPAPQGTATPRATRVLGLPPLPTLAPTATLPGK